MLKDQFISRLILIAFFGIVYICTMTKMASSNSAETTPQKHVALKIVGSICLLLSVANLIWGINLLSQVQFPEQINIYGFYEPARRYPTYEQNQIITCIGHVFSGLAWASYCFFFRASDRKVWKKILIFIYGLLMYVFYCSSIKFQEFGAKEGVAMGLFIIMTLLCIVFDGLKEQQLEQQDKQEGKSAVYTICDQKSDNGSESKEDDTRFMPYQNDDMESEPREDDSRFMPHQNDGMAPSPRTSSENEEESVHDFPDRFICCDEKHTEVQEATNHYNDLPKYCRHCGKEVDYANSRYCKYCGSKLKP